MNKKQQILIADDDAELTDLLKKSLQNENFDVHVSNRCLDAKDKITQFKYHCIIIDLRLDTGSGLKLIQELRAPESKNKINHQTPVMLLSGHLDTDILKEAAGYVQGAITKPIDMKTLLTKINQVIDHKKLFPETTAEVQPSNDELSKQFSAFLHSFAGRMMTIGLLTQQLEDVLSEKPELKEENDLAQKLLEQIQKTNSLIELVRTEFTSSSKK